jgi:hypothetical protein
MPSRHCSFSKVDRARLCSGCAEPASDAVKTTSSVVWHKCQ